ncbi:HAD family hydrolase [Herbaspirillum robiniae]|uniref:Phosphate acetyltransferase n=1 Tax=Herbaspirillum robiniae TaxID=2014887 RepID=A0A246WQ70_9BURK|nr:HAD family hydrolase [Herbaspirillum robiniae]OWY28516.1 phosphate acetyltransferase [Herbaspirillum robiniae]
MPLIALDADGVLLDYHAAYRDAWFRAFGVNPSLRNPLAYWPVDRWDVEILAGADLGKFRAQFDEKFWSSIPPCVGAVDACLQLRRAGFDLVCVTALEERFLGSRKENLLQCGFPIAAVYGTDGTAGDVSPKAAILEALRPMAFVDDFLPYFRGVPTGIHRALVVREPHGSPNVGPDLSLIQSQHPDLAHFSKWVLRDGLGAGA